MTLTPLTAEQTTALRVQVGVLAWQYYEALDPEDQLDLPAALSVYRDLRLVAAEVLELVCLKARQRSVSASATRSFTIGPIKVERAQVGTVDAASADAWCQRAAQLRQTVRRSASRSVSVDVQAGF